MASFDPETGKCLVSHFALWQNLPMQRPGYPRKIDSRKLIVGLLVLLAIPAAIYWWFRSRPPKPLVEAVTVAGTGPRVASAGLTDPFGIAVDKGGNVFVSDGLGGRIHRLRADGHDDVVVTGLNMPSAIAFSRDGSLLVANTGAHTIVQADISTGTFATLAGEPGVSGYVDGARSEARFNAPVGLAIDASNSVIIADTYNDRIRIISETGDVKTIAGGAEPGLIDAVSVDARFDTPCGVAIAPDGAILVADTGNNRIRKVTREGAVTTFADRGERDSADGQPIEASFYEPLSIAIRRDGAIFVADSGGSRVRLIETKENPRVTTVTGNHPSGLVDGPLAEARFNRIAGIAFGIDDELWLADAGNGFVRALLPEGRSKKMTGRRAKASEASLSASDIRAAVAPRWPFEPAAARREIAGTFGEIRGETIPGHDSWFHSGLDIPGGYGETAHAVFGEQVTLPLAVEGAGGTRERLRLPLFGYIHIRVGRDANDHLLPGFEQRGLRLRRDEAGEVTGVRLPRGARFKAGDALGTLNRLNHVHLVAGPPGEEVNALAALSLPGLVDKTPPSVLDVVLTDEAGNARTRERDGNANRFVVQGRTRIIVKAYDQVDGNAAYRKLAPFRLSYQVLTESGEPAPGFELEHENIVFEKLPVDRGGVSIVYAPGSQSGYEGATVFAYLVTNIARDGKAEEGFWNASELPPGKYVVRVVVEDFFGNKTRRDVPVRIAG